MNKYMVIQNNYDDWDFREGGCHLGFGAGFEKLYFLEINSYPH